MKPTMEVASSPRLIPATRDQSSGVLAALHYISSKPRAGKGENLPSRARVEGEESSRP